MFRTLQNTASLDFTLVPDGPIVIRAQTVGIDPGVADMEFQRTHRNGQSTVFLAGSGLKGVIRAHGERLLRSSGRYACDPTNTRDQAICGRRQFGAPQLPNYPHANQCGACFTFGSLNLAGRFRVGDAYPAEGMEEEANRTEVRTGVGIDRKSQAAAQGVLYDTEVVVGGGFRVRVQGENFSLWQLGLILATLQDMDSGLVQIGGGKARGMGSVRLQDWVVELGFLNRETGQLTGARPNAGDDGQYGLPQNDVLPAPEGGAESRRGLFRVLHYEGDAALASLAAALIENPLQRYLEGRG
ncbi:MAG TPA: RAMP superfamily CRISPR-associated protein [Thermoanaerobaculia bacterium]|nr:RAMP superfamily CRISPR-associated protein [Thermoanaerobaculia bacterium]